MRDAARLALGTLTVIPVRPPRDVDRRTGGRAMVLAPVVGLLLGVPVAVVLAVLDAAPTGLPPLLAATLAVTVVAALTRGIHLDGLADTADGLGSGKAPDEALAIMRKSDVGPFGVATLVLTLLLQVSALATAFARGSGPAALVLALVVSRLALPLACSRGVPAARADGLGRTVAGSVGRGGLLVSVLVAVLSVAAFLGVDALVRDTGSSVTGSGVGPRWLLLSGVVPLLAGWLMCRRCVRRLGGVTGDVLGACVEVTFAASLVLGTFG